jgi:hypothetical protein
LLPLGVIFSLVVLFSLLFFMVLFFTTYSWKHGKLKKLWAKR